MSVSETSRTKQAAWVAIGSFFSFIVGIISPMILARYFDKGDYGTYKQVMFVYNTLLAVFTLGLPKAYAYFLPKYESKYSKDIISKITKIFIILGLAFSALLYLGAGSIASFLNNPDLKTALKYFAPTPLFLLPTMGLDGIYATFKQTKYLAYYTIITRILTIACIILPVLIWGGNYIHAIIGFDVASLITCLIASFMKIYPVRHEQHEKSDLYYKRIFDFALPLLYASLWGMVIVSANQFFISRYYGNEVFAEFSNGFMEIPFVGMVIGAVGTVLLPAFSAMNTDKGMSIETLQLWNTALIKSAKIIFPMLMYGMFFSKIIMTCMYGDGYSQSSVYFLIKNCSSLLYIIPFAPIILAMGKTKQYANVHMLVAIIIIIADYAAIRIFNSAIYVAVASELCQALKIFLLMRIIAISSRQKIFDMLPLKPLSLILFALLLASTATYILMSVINYNKYVELLISLSAYLILYYCLCWVFKISYKDIAASFLSNSNIVKILP